MLDKLPSTNTASNSSTNTLLTKSIASFSTAGRCGAGKIATINSNSGNNTWPTVLSPSGNSARTRADGTANSSSANTRKLKASKCAQR